MTSHHAHTPLRVMDKSVPHSHRSGPEQGGPSASLTRSPLIEAGQRGPACPTRTHMEGTSGVAPR